MVITRGVALTLGVLSLGVLASACGGGSSPGVASIGPSTKTTLVTGAKPKGNSGNPTQQLNYVTCLHSHGYPGFPEPGASSKVVSKALAQINLRSPQFHKAMHTCDKYLPKSFVTPTHETPQLQAALLKFTACMRSHGMPSWPDPLPGGVIPYPSGSEANSPTFKAAFNTCLPLIPQG